MQAAFHTKGIGSLVFRPGGSVEVFTEKDRKMTSKNSIKKLYSLQGGKTFRHFVPHFLANRVTTEIIKAY